MTMNHAFRIACCAGRVDDFDDVVGCDLGGYELPNRPQRCDFVEGVVVDHYPGARLRLNPADKVGRETIIDGDGFNASSDTRPENRHPFQPIFGPDQDAIALVNFAPVEVLDNSTDLSIELRICGYPASEAVGPSYGFTIAEAPDVGKQIGECPH